MIKKFINEGYKEGEFEITVGKENDSLIWKILKL